MAVKIALVTLRQEFHDNFNNEPKGGGKVTQIFKLPFTKGYCVAIGRNPRLNLAEEVIYTPSQWMTRHIGHLRCLESGSGLIYILDIEADERFKIYNTKNGLQITRQHRFSDGDCLKLDGVPVFLDYVEKETDDSEEFKATTW